MMGSMRRLWGLSTGRTFVRYKTTGTAAKKRDERGQELLREIRQKHEQGSQLSAEAFVPVLTNFQGGFDSDVTNVLHVVSVMEDMRVMPNVEVYNSIIHTFCRAQLFREAQRIVDHMLAHGFYPTEDTFMPILNQLCQVGQMQSAANLCQRMRQLDIALSAAPYQLLLRSYLQHKRLPRGLDFFEALCQDGFVPTVEVYRPVYQQLLAQGDSQEALELVSHLHKYNRALTGEEYTIMVNEFRAFPNKALGIIYLMQERDIPTDKLPFHLPIRSFCRENKIESACLIIQRLEKQNIPLQGGYLLPIVELLLQQEQFSKAQTYLEKMEQLKIPLPNALKALVDENIKQKE